MLRSDARPADIAQPSFLRTPAEAIPRGFPARQKVVFKNRILVGRGKASVFKNRILVGRGVPSAFKNAILVGKNSPIRGHSADKDALFEHNLQGSLRQEPCAALRATLPLDLTARPLCEKRRKEPREEAS